MAILVVFKHSGKISVRIAEPLFSPAEFHGQRKTVVVAAITDVVIIEQVEIIACKFPFLIFREGIVIVYLEQPDPLLVLFRIYPHLQGERLVQAQHAVGRCGISVPLHAAATIQHRAAVELRT